jgi:hypothetical protein
MKNADYHNFTRQFIGSSDIASLVLVGCRTGAGAVAEMLHFGEDGNYYAYIVDQKIEIPSHYKLVTSFESWLKIYDDDELIYKCSASQIDIYRAGDFGCIINILK